MLSLAVEELLNNIEEKYIRLDSTSEQIIQNRQKRAPIICYIFFKSLEMILMIQG